MLNEGRRIDEGRKIFIPVLSGLCGHNNKATHWVVFKDCTCVCGMFSFCSAGGKGEAVKTLIASMIIGLVLISHYILILCTIALSKASMFGRIIMGIMVTILFITTLNFLELNFLE